MNYPQPPETNSGSGASKLILTTRDSTLAIASLITGILGWILVPVFGSLAAIITGHLAKKEIREGNGMITGKGMATAGLLLGYIQLILLVIFMIGLIVFLLTRPQISGVFQGISTGY